ncbi:MAG: hypothetical protein AB7G37_06525 [Solirubrobacteraceae bacterium]
MPVSRTVRRLALAVGAAGLGMCGAAPALAAPGDRVDAFGRDGIATIHAGRDVPTTGRTIARGADGSLVVAGRSARRDVVVERITPDGRRDDGFGDGGRVVLDLGTPTDDVAGVRVLPDGRILLGAGSASGFVAIRLLTDGSPDPGYGVDGRVEVGVPAVVAPGDGNPVLVRPQVQAFAVDDDGAVALAGRLLYEHSDRGYRFALVVVDPDGRPRAGFGVAGVARVSPILNASLAGQDRVDGLAFRPDGGLLLTGTGSLDEERYVTRVAPDGAVDHDFATRPEPPYESHVPEPPRAPDRAWDRPQTGSLVTAPDGAFVVIRAFRTSGAADRHVGLHRWTADGAVDDRFGDDGTVIADDVRPATGVPAPDGGVVALTTAGVPRRYRADGSVVGGFGDGLRGDLLVAGPTGVDVVALDDGDPGTVRRSFVPWNGDATVGPVRAGVLRGGSSRSRALDAAVQSDGRIVLLTTVDGRRGGLARLLPDGRPDPSFGDGGTVPPPVDAEPLLEHALGVDVVPPRFRPHETIRVTLDARDRILVAEPGPPDPDGVRTTVVRRLLPDGAPDRSWGVDGVAALPGLTSDAPQAVADGSGVVVLSERARVGELRRLDDHGRPDPTWGDGGGVRVVPPPRGSDPHDALGDRALGALTDGGVVATAIIDGSWVALRLDARGRPVTGYGEAGWARSHLAGWLHTSGRVARVLPDGRVVLALPEDDGVTVRTIGRDGRVEADFSGDPAFTTPGEQGVNRNRYPTLAVLTDGSIVVAGAANGLDPGTTDVVRLRPDGALDPTFGVDGRVRTTTPDGAMSDRWPTSIVALPGGDALLLGDAGGDAAALRLRGGGTMPARRPLLDVDDLQLQLASDQDARLTLRLSGPMPTPVDVRVRTTDATVDIQPVDEVVTFPPGATEVPVTVRVNDGADGDRAGFRVEATPSGVRARRRPWAAAGSVVATVSVHGRPEAPRTEDPWITPTYDDGLGWRCHGNVGGTRPMTITWSWYRRGVLVPGADGPVIRREPIDDQRVLHCRMTAVNVAGRDVAESRPAAAQDLYPQPLPPPAAQPAPPPAAGPSGPTPTGPAPTVRGSTSEDTPPATSHGRTRITRMILKRDRAGFRTDRAGRFLIRIEARGATGRRARRSGVARRRWVSVRARRPGTVRVRLRPRLARGSYRVAVLPGADRRAKPLSIRGLRVRR